MATVIFALCASDIATSLQLWVGYPHPNKLSFRVCLLTECAYSKTEHEPQGIAQTAHRQRQHAVAHCREPRLSSQSLTAQALFTLKKRWTKTQTAIPCECLLGEVRLWRKRNIPQSKQRLDITAQSAISSCNARYHHEVISFFRVIARSNECCDVAI